MEGTPEHPGVDDVVRRIEAKIAERDYDGSYPPDLAEDLQQHFRRVATHRASLDRDALRQALEDLERLAPLSGERIVLDSGMPGGRRLHTLVARLVARQTQGVLEQVQEFAEATRHVLRLAVEALEEPHGHVHADLVGQLDALFDRVASFERGPVDSQAAVADVRRRVEALEAAERDRVLRPPYSTARFEDLLRGSRDDAVAGYEDLAKRFADCAPVLDLGSGRGDFLEALARVGVEARGVEADGALAAACRARGLAVEEGDPRDALRAAASASLGGVSLVGSLERLTPQQAVDVVSLAADRLRAGGRFVVEAANPQSPAAHAGALHLDPTARPYHADYVAFVVREACFGDVEVGWRGHPGADEPASGPLRYAVVATR